MAKYRKKPVVIEAVRWNGSTVGLTNGGIPFKSERLEKPEWMPPAKVTEIEVPLVPAGDVWRRDDFLFIGTLEGTHRADPGDWIIRGVAGELYPCKPNIFEATYEPAE